MADSIDSVVRLTGSTASCDLLANYYAYYYCRVHVHTHLWQDIVLLMLIMTVFPNVQDSSAPFWTAAAITACQDASNIQDHEAVIFGCLR